MLELFKLAVRKTLLSDDVHVLSDTAPQSHLSNTNVLMLVSHKRSTNELPEQLKFHWFQVVNSEPQSTENSWYCQTKFNHV